MSQKSDDCGCQPAKPIRRRSRSRSCGGARRKRSRSRRRRRSSRRRSSRRHKKTCRPGKVSRNPFFNYLRCFRSRHCGWSAKKVAVEGAKRWCAMSRAKRRKFEDIARQARSRMRAKQHKQPMKKRRRRKSRSRCKPCGGEKPKRRRRRKASRSRSCRPKKRSVSKILNRLKRKMKKRRRKSGPC